MVCYFLINSFRAKAKQRWEVIKKAVRSGGDLDKTSVDDGTTVFPTPDYKVLAKPSSTHKLSIDPAEQLTNSFENVGSVASNDFDNAAVSKYFVYCNMVRRLRQTICQRNAIQESDILLQFWENQAIPEPELPVFPHEVKLEYPSNEVYKETVEGGLNRDGQPIQLVVSRVPSDILEARKKRMEKNIIDQKMSLLEAEKARTVDVIWRYAVHATLCK